MTDNSPDHYSGWLPRDVIAHVLRIRQRWSPAGLADKGRPSYQQGLADIRLLIAALEQMRGIGQNRIDEMKACIESDRRHQRNINQRLIQEMQQVADKYSMPPSGEEDMS